MIGLTTLCERLPCPTIASDVTGGPCCENAAFRRLAKLAGTLFFGQRLNCVGWVNFPE
ncbi:hypothetical protein SAMN04489733_5709 [Amycolatopsis keratiniphila]|nr:hypothetical protein SAMN04489733_5709 [Amycolatopsis keratiniphila]